MCIRKIMKQGGISLIVFFHCCTNSYQCLIVMFVRTMTLKPLLLERSTNVSYLEACQAQRDITFKVAACTFKILPLPHVVPIQPPAFCCLLYWCFTTLTIMSGYCIMLRCKSMTITIIYHHPETTNACLITCSLIENIIYPSMLSTAGTRVLQTFQRYCYMFDFI